MYQQPVIKYNVLTDVERLEHFDYHQINEYFTSINTQNKNIRSKGRCFYSAVTRIDTFLKEYNSGHWYFITLTFGKYNKTYEEYNVKSITNMISKIHKLFNFHLQVRELGGENKRQHYHLLVNSEYAAGTLYKYIHSIWYFGRIQVKPVTDFNKNRLCNYITKYMTTKDKQGRLVCSVPMPKKETLKQLQQMLLVCEYAKLKATLEYARGEISKDKYEYQMSLYESEYQDYQDRIIGIKYFMFKNNILKSNDCMFLTFVHLTEQGFRKSFNRCGIEEVVKRVKEVSNND